MNKPDQLNVHINQIDFDDRTYVFTFEPILSPITSSIEKIGLINPPVLEQISDENYRIVSGLKRVLALKHLKKNLFVANAFRSRDDAPDFELFQLNLFENIGTRNLNVIEKAIIIDKLINTFHLSEEKVMADFFPSLDLGSNKFVLERYLKLVNLEDNIKIAVVEDFISIDIAIALLSLPIRERQLIFNLFQQVKLGKNRQKEFLRLIQEIAEITNHPIEKIVENDDIQTILFNDKITPPRKAEQVKWILTKLRYPTYADVEERFQKIKKGLKLPPNVILRPPPFFEGEDYTIEFKFKDESDLKKVTSILNTIIDQDQIAKLKSLV